MSQLDDSYSEKSYSLAKVPRSSLCFFLLKSNHECEETGPLFGDLLKIHCCLIEFAKIYFKHSSKKTFCNIIWNLNGKVSRRMKELVLMELFGYTFIVSFCLFMAPSSLSIFLILSSLCPQGPTLLSLCPDR